jgi:hypothetical protein
MQNIGEVDALIGVGLESSIQSGGVAAFYKWMTSKNKATEDERRDLSRVSKAALGTAALRTGLAGVWAAQGGKFSAPTKRLKTAIALHMPTSLAIRYSANYEEIETSNTFLAAVNAAQMNIPGVTGAGSALAMKNAPHADILSKISKTAINPSKEQIFRSVDFRTFQFSYKFAPRDETEAKYVLNIIDQFKFHMYPEFKDETGFLYIFPSEFDIVYYSGSGENTNVHKHTSCVLTEMNVNYTPNGVFTTFNNGMPTQIEIQLTFKELALLDKKKIQDGGF